ncbi:hypothetical protein SLEP1_g50409 [Rubroshorea leprosula]|uniref:Uncharacterized protein n=1 Tax=Rubroshorea leprosula TaxID=152421 RepID=A0AAV5LZW2_9ROSI|nr:hypothetical protein SLEP1_g50409 [Rubroshorea leprosula]
MSAWRLARPRIWVLRRDRFRELPPALPSASPPAKSGSVG